MSISLKFLGSGVNCKFTKSSRFLTFKRQRWKEESKLITSAGCYPALKVTDNMVFFKTTVKLCQLFLSAVQFVRKKIIFNRIRRIALVEFAYKRAFSRELEASKFENLLLLRRQPSAALE